MLWLEEKGRFDSANNMGHSLFVRTLSFLATQRHPAMLLQGEADAELKAAEAAADAEVTASGLGSGYAKPDVRELLAVQMAMLPYTAYKVRACTLCRLIWLSAVHLSGVRELLAVQIALPL